MVNFIRIVMVSEVIGTAGEAFTLGLWRDRDPNEHRLRETLHEQIAVALLKEGRAERHTVMLGAQADDGAGHGGEMAIPHGVGGHALRFDGGAHFWGEVIVAIAEYEAMLFFQNSPDRVFARCGQTEQNQEHCGILVWGAVKAGGLCGYCTVQTARGRWAKRGGGNSQRCREMIPVAPVDASP